MATREQELKELADSLRVAIAKARGLNLPTSAYVLSMALVEVSRVLAAEQGGDETK